MRALWPGKPYPRGATFTGEGVNFAVFSHVATRVEVCLFEADDSTGARERGRDRQVLAASLGWPMRSPTGLVSGL